MEIDAVKMGRALIDEAVRLISEKDEKSTLIERHFLIDEAWNDFESEPQPILMGKGLCQVLSRCSLPISENDLLLGRYVDRVPDEQEEARFVKLVQSMRLRNNPIINQNGGHLTLDFSTAIRLGLPGLTAKVESLQSGKHDPNEVSQIRGMLLCYEAMKIYIRRYGEAALTKGRPDMAAVCESLLTEAPRSFRDALQLMVFVFTVYMIYAGAPVNCISFGRIDQFLLPLYQRDISTGVLTKEEAGALIDDFYSKCSLHLGRGEHQMGNPALGGHYTGWDRNQCFDSPTYFTLGGLAPDGTDGCNELTELMLSHVEPRLKNPVIIFRYHSRIQQEIWDIVVRKAMKNASFLIYNDDVVIPAYLHSGVDRVSAYNYSIHPCNWADIDSCGVIIGSVGGYLPEIIMQVLNESSSIQDMDALYNAIADHFRASLKEPFRCYRETFSHPERMPSNGHLGFHDAFLGTCVDKGRSRYDGGSKYYAFYALLRNIGTAADMLSSIEELVFKKKICTLQVLLDACHDNFENRPDLLHFAQKAPKYGTDNALADGHARRLMTLLLDILDEESLDEKGERDVLTLNVTINDMNHLYFGHEFGATPDGRKAGEPLSENLSPSVGYVSSLTSLLNSVASLPTDRLHSGALNGRIGSDILKRENGALLLNSLLTTYFKKGGLQIQISVADTETLRSAQACPECYRDLTVRITGYSAIFVDMSKNAQDEIIRRDELAH
ncbi:MAG: hypothetical protein II710_01165 [Clostridia bacterium]|nr:hypothetical protein [Clostridia bacterium]